MPLQKMLSNARTASTPARVGGAVLGVIVLLKVKNKLLGGGAAFDKEQAKYRKCNRCDYASLSVFGRGYSCASQPLWHKKFIFYGG